MRTDHAALSKLVLCDMPFTTGEAVDLKSVALHLFHRAPASCKQRNELMTDILSKLPFDKGDKDKCELLRYEKKMYAINNPEPGNSLLPLD